LLVFLVLRAFSAHASSIRRIEASSEDWKFHLNTHLGEIAALATAVSWALVPPCSVSAHRDRFANVNSGRLAVAAAFLSLSYFIAELAHRCLRQDGWLGLSGIVGFIIGVPCFRAFVLVGLAFHAPHHLFPAMSALLAGFSGRNAEIVEIFAIA
jgi:hypothetical protein